MFKQFTENISGNQIYLLFSLGIFLAFFIIVTILLIRLGKAHVEHMSELPLGSDDADTPNPIKS